MALRCQILLDIVILFSFKFVFNSCLSTKKKKKNHDDRNSQCILVNPGKKRGIRGIF